MLDGIRSQLVQLLKFACGYAPAGIRKVMGQPKLTNHLFDSKNRFLHLPGELHTKPLDDCWLSTTV